MLIPTFGPPSAFTQCCIFMMRGLIEELLGGASYVSAVEMARLREGWAERQHPDVVFFADCPERSVVDTFVKLPVPPIIFLEDPNAVTAYIAADRSMTLPWAARLAHQCMACIRALIVRDNAYLIRRSANLTIRTFLHTVAAAIGHVLTEEQLRSSMRRSGLSEDYDPDGFMEAVLLAHWPKASPIGEELTGLAPAERDVIRRVNAPLARLIAGLPVQGYDWPAEMFIAGDRPDECLPETIDMTGGARCLCYGPYLHLPPGNWLVSMDLEVQQNFSGNRFDFDVYQNEVKVLEHFTIPAEGQFRLQASFDVVEPRDAIQVRVIMREGAIEGTLHVRSASVAPV